MNVLNSLAAVTYKTIPVSWSSFGRGMVMKSVHLVFVMLFGVMAVLPLTAYSQAAAKPAIAGALLPLSGEYAPYGKLLYQGLELGAGSEVRWVINDTGTMSGKQGTSAALHLLEMEKVSLVVTLGIDDAESIAPIFNRKRVPLLIAWDSGPRVNALGEYVFSAGYETASGGRQAALLLAEQVKIKRVAILAEESSYNRSAVEAFKKEANLKGLELVFEEWHGLGEADFRSSLLHLRRNRADSIYLMPSLPGTFLEMLQQMEVLKIAIPFATNELLIAAPGVILPGYAKFGCGTWIPRSGSEALEQLFKAKFGEEPWNYGPLRVGYDTGKLAQQVLTSTQNPQDALTAILGTSHRADKQFQMWCHDKFGAKDRN